MANTSEQKITPFLWFDGRLEEAIDFYTSIFNNVKIINSRKMGDQLFTATFQLEGQEFMGLNGGPMFQFTEAVSFFIKCKTQDEVDNFWDKLSEGGSKSRCGWLKDKFGLSWQVVPDSLGKLLSNPDPAKAKRTMDAMMKMGKLIIKDLENA